MNFNKLNFNRIKQIQFSLLSPEEIQRIAVFKLTNFETLSDEKKPERGGLSDPRLGAHKPYQECPTCKKSFLECPGHFGYISLKIPVINPLYFKEFSKFIKKICPECSHYKETSFCENCNKTTPLIFIGEDQSSFIDSQPVLMDRIYDIVLQFPPQQGINFGLKNNQLHYFLFTNFLIPSNKVRPTISLPSGQRSEDDLTYKLAEIIRLNFKVAEYINNEYPIQIIFEIYSLLCYHISTYFNNEQTKLPQSKHRTGKPLKSLAQRIKGKEGRFRLNLLGKRTNFSARSVIAPNTKLKLDEVEIPLQIAEELTKKVYCNPYNIENIKKSIIDYFENNGPKIYYRIIINKIKYILTQFNYQSILESIAPGIIFERRLLDGDLILFNRQPSLHRTSIMAHKIIINSDPNFNCFRLNPFVCGSYNADFDGDEMNIHVLQSLSAEREAEILMSPIENRFSLKSGAVLFGAIQDLISTVYLLTKSNNKFDYQQIIYLLKGVVIPKKILFSKSTQFTGKDIFSCILPPSLSMEYTISSSLGNNKITIKNGQLMSGILDKSSLSGSGKLIIELSIHYENYLIQFYQNLMRLSDNFARLYGITLSGSDFQIPADLRKELESELTSFEKQPNSNSEIDILDQISNSRLKLSSILEKEFQRDSSLNNIIFSGARGSFLNYSQVIAFLGQQFRRGNRIQSLFSEPLLSQSDKSISHFGKRGFVSNSYFSGLSEQEYFFHGISGREGIIDISIRTSQAGYFQRKLIHALENVYIEKPFIIKDGLYQLVPAEDKNFFINPQYSKLLNSDKEGIHKDSFYFSPGLPIGVISAHCIGEPSTQLTMRTFYSAGSDEESITTEEGLPKIINLLHMKKRSFSEIRIRFFLKEPFCYSQKDTIEFADSLLPKTIEDYFYCSIENNSLILVLKENVFDIISSSEFKQFLKAPHVFETPTKIKFNFNSISELIAFQTSIYGFNFGGIKKLEDVFVRAAGNKYEILCKGGIFKSFLKFDQIDFNTLQTNNVFDIYQFYGIEGVYEFSLREINGVLQKQGINIHHTYLRVIVESLLKTGAPSSIMRGGIIKEKPSVLARASFETPIKVISSSAIKEEIDPLLFFSENIIIGQKLKLGMDHETYEYSIEQDL